MNQTTLRRVLARTLGVALLFSSCLVTAALAAESPEPAGVTARELALKGGARAVVVPRAGVGAVLIAAAVPAGSADEDPAHAGLSHYLEHLLFDGFDGMGERGVTEAFERAGAYVNAFTREQSTVFFVLSPPESAPESARLLAGMLTRSTISEPVYEKERGVILEELAKDAAQPSMAREAAIRRLLWDGTNFAHPIGGTPESVEATPREGVIAYWQERYRPAGFRLLALGDLPDAELEAVLAPFGGAWTGEMAPARSDTLAAPGWGHWRAAAAPKTKPAGGGPSGMPPGMMGGRGGHGMPRGPKGGELALVLAAPDTLAQDGAALALLAQWLEDPAGPLHRVLGPEKAAAISAVRLPRDPRDLIEIRVEAAPKVSPETLLPAVLGALDAAAAGPSDADVARLSGADAAHRAREGQRLHQVAVLFGEALSAARGSLVETIVAAALEPAAVRSAAGALFGESRARTRAAWLGEGGPSEATPLPESVAPEAVASEGALETGPFGARVATLGNGLVLGVLEEPGSPVFGVHLLVADRGLRETQPGLGDLWHRLLPAGTALGGSASLARRMERLGVSLKEADNPVIPFDDRYHRPDFSYLRLEGPAESLEPALALLAELLRAPEWDEDGIRSGLARHDKARQAGARGGAPARRALRAHLFGAEHPLAMPAAGDPGAPLPSAEKLATWRRAWPSGYFDPSRLVLSIASPAPAEQVASLAGDLFGDGPESKPQRGPYPPAQPGAAPVAETPAGPQLTVLWGRLARVPADQRAPLLLALSALSDRMVAEIREKEGLAYRLGAGAEGLATGEWLIAASVGTRPKNRARVETRLAELMEELATKPLPKSELERLVARGRRSTMLRGLAAASRAYRLGRALFEGEGCPLLVDEAALAAVTPEELRAAAERWLSAGALTRIAAP